jgi:hypothetical protein
LFKHLKELTAFISLATLITPPVSAYDSGLNQRNGIRRVLLISIDGMHALDYQNCVANNQCPNLAALGTHGVNYTRTSTSKPSDSFPGLVALVTGATPKTAGAFYDVSYDRVLAPPQNTTGNGLAGGTCTPGVANGTTTEFEEGVEIDQSMLNGGGPYSTTDGGIKSIDPTKLPRDPFNGCSPVYPWQFIRTNSIYGLIHAAGGYTAWSDKHAVYAVVSGHGNNANNVDDYYSPEINSNVINLPGVMTATGHSCAVPVGTGDWTKDFTDIQCYDTLKVKAILNEIDGKTHDGLHKAPVPNIFGMNFQAVSVGQKLIEGGVKGGYTDAAGTPTAPMLSEIEFVDASIGQMVTELKEQNLLESTLIVVTAKHGQSPMDTHKFQELGHGITTTPADLLAADLPFSESPLNPNGIGPTQDDISLLWLSDSSKTLADVAILEANLTAAGIGQIFYGPSITTMFNAPGLPAAGGDPRTPDIIVQPNVGVVYTGSGSKQSEHGGFSHDDTNVMMLVSNPDFAASTVTAFVETTQVAPTILQALGLDPSQLDGVQKEGTAVLPGLPFNSNGK